jgi:hypothetical protein
LSNNKLYLAGYNLEAFFYYNKALRINPTHTEFLLGAAKLLRAKGQYARLHQFKYRLDTFVVQCDIEYSLSSLLYNRKKEQLLHSNTYIGHETARETLVFLGAFSTERKIIKT